MAVVSGGILRLNGITKRFPGVLALDSVDMEIKAGHVHGLLGENGAGKSTLIKILAGAYLPDSGRMHFNGSALDNLTPRKSIDAGIACIYQELNLIPHMTVAENIFLGQEITTVKKFGIIDRRRMNEESSQLLRELELTMDPRIKTGTLGIGHQQMVEICRAVSSDAKLIIMDEPTSSLTQREAAELFKMVAKLKSRGVTILFISHRLEEAKRICDEATVLRDGRKAADMAMKDTTIDEIIRHMVGRDIKDKFPKLQSPRHTEALSVEGLTTNGVLHDISFKLWAGEVLGVAGLVGAGRTEMARAIMGADPIDAGVIRVFGKEKVIRSPRDAVKAGIALLTENRKEQGLILIQDIAFNATLVGLNQHASFGLLKLKAIREVAEKLAHKLRVRPPGVNRKVVQLSGGNQQKVVIAKWLCSGAKIFIFDEPTRGIDVGAKVEVYNLINSLVQEGAAVMIICSEMPEVLGMSDRIIVMHEGRLTAEFSREEATQEKIMYAAVGAHQSAERKA